MINQHLLKAFSEGLKPAQKLSIEDWALKYVVTKRSSRSKNVDLAQTPWLIDPLESLFDYDSKEIVLQAPTGSGKTTALEVAGNYIVAEKPGPVLFASQTEGDMSDWYDVGLLPSLKANPLINPFWSKDRHKTKKNLILFSHMPIYFGGANKSTLQSKSVDYGFGDEIWIWKPGMVEELRKRNHDRFNNKIFLVSQAGVVGDDLDKAFNQTTKKEFCFSCPECGGLQPWKWEQIKYSHEENDNGVIWSTLDVEYECECCQKRFKDTPDQRRKLSNSGRYMEEGDNTNALPGHVGYHYNILCVWWVEWKEVVRNFIQANEMKKKGNLLPLSQWKQKRMAEPWEEDFAFEDVELSLGGYLLSGAKEQIGTGKVLMAVDVQQDMLYYVIRVFFEGGSSKLLKYGIVINFNDLLPLMEEWGISYNSLFIDSAYRPLEVQAFTAKHQQIGLNGRGEDGYEVKDTKTGRIVKRVYSNPKRIQTNEGQALLIYYSSKRVKDLLDILRNGHGVRWDVPNDVCEKYKLAMNSEIKKPTPTGYDWVTVKEKNHWWDCEVMLLVGAMNWRAYPAIIIDDGGHS